MNEAEGRLAREAALYSRAIDDPTTQVALRRLRKRAWRAIRYGLLVAFVAVIVLGLLANEDGELPGGLELLTLAGVIATLLLVGFGMAGLINSAFAARVLRNSAWRVHEAKFRHVSFNNGAPAIVMSDEPERVFFLSGTKFRTREWDEFDGPLLVAGTGYRRVVARPDRAIVRLAYPTIRRGLARRTREFVETTPPRLTVTVTGWRGWLGR